MAKIKIRAAFRDWDYLTPLLLGDIRSDHVDLDIERVGTLVTNLAEIDSYDVAETSFSRYASARAVDDDRLIGVPHFLMRGFRHRCLITRKDSPITTFSQLKDKRIGVTGWRDSGNVWTRTALFQEGLDVEDAYWYAGRLTEAHPIIDRLDGFGRPGRIEAVPDEKPMVELLENGWLDAIMTPFMPDGFYNSSTSFRQLLPDFRASEQAYYDKVGYIPGIHMLAFKKEFVEKHSEALVEVDRLLNTSKKLWLNKRRKYAETTPWILDDLEQSAYRLAGDWDSSGLVTNSRMITDFASELYRQKILPHHLTVEDLFPHRF